MPEKAGQTHHDETLHALRPKIGNSSAPPFELRRGTHPWPLPGGDFLYSPPGSGQGWVPLLSSKGGAELLPILGRRACKVSSWCVCPAFSGMRVQGVCTPKRGSSPSGPFLLMVRKFKLL